LQISDRKKLWVLKILIVPPTQKNKIGFKPLFLHFWLNFFDKRVSDNFPMAKNVGWAIAHLPSHAP